MRSLRLMGAIVVLLAAGTAQALPPLMGIRGKVTGPAGPVANACVYLQDPGQPYGFLEYTTTGPDGVYNFARSDGTYVVLVASCTPDGDFSPEYVGDSYTWEGARRIEVGIGAAANGDLTVEPGGWLTGSITSDGLPFEGCLWLRRVSPPSLANGWLFFNRPTSPREDDTYSYGGLAPGDYHLRTGCSEDHPEVFAPDAPSVEHAALITIGIGQGSEMDIHIPQPGRIVGTVTTDGQPVSACLTYRDEHGHVVARGGTSGGDGFTSGPLAPGNIVIEVSDCEDDVQGVDGEFYPDALSFEQAVPLTVTAGETISGIDIDVSLCQRPGDIDGDGLDNCAELDVGTDPGRADSDDDDLTDAEEVRTYHTDPTTWDTDGDTFSDGMEVKGARCDTVSFEGGSDPNDAASTPLGSAPVSVGRIRTLPVGSYPCWVL